MTNLDRVKEILKEMATEPKGAWNNDLLVYHKNVINWYMEKAQEALEFIQTSGEKMNE